MAEKSDDKNAGWREKYLDALDQQERSEKAAAAQQELLRRALVRVSVSADGQDDVLDTVLGQLRERMRGTIDGDINGLLTRLDQAVLSFEQQREANAQRVRESLVGSLRPWQQLDLSRAVKKEIRRYLSDLPERTRKIHLYPALLEDLARIQALAVKEIEQPKAGFLQKLLGSKVDAPAEDFAAPIAVEDVDTDIDESEVAPAAAPGGNSPPLIALSNDLAAQAKIARALPNADAVGANALPPEFVANVTQIINQFLVGLENEAPLVKKVQAIRARISADMSIDMFVGTLENLRDLVMQAYLASNQAFAAYLKNVNQELTDIYSVIGGSAATESSRRSAASEMQAAMMQEMAALESNAESATDLAQLKQQVKSQLGNIREALTHYQEAEQAQDHLAEQLDALASKVKHMEEEAEKSRAVLEKQRHKALHDPLTGLPNREYYNERSQYEFQRWQRYGRPLVVAIFDIDHFKKINDTHGHQTGDRVLKVIGQSIAKRLREVDFFCRFGGEEFLALMPETSLQDALPVLDKIRAAIANAAFNYKDQPLAITLSIGVTEFKQDDDLESAFVRADEALYEAKSNGRNKVQSH